MPLQKHTLASAVAAMICFPAIAVADDRPPNPDERAQIEKSLGNAGYISWEEIEFDDGMWEVDDAMKEGDNREFDLKLDPNTYEIKVEREDL